MNSEPGHYMGLWRVYHGEYLDLWTIDLGEYVDVWTVNPRDDIGLWTVNRLFLSLFLYQRILSSKERKSWLFMYRETKNTRYYLHNK